MTTKEFVEELDQILTSVPDTGGIHVHKVNKVSFEILGDRLAKDGYGKWLGGHEFEVNLRGVDYVKSGGYSGLYSTMTIKRKNRQSNLKMPRKQINALKREPYLIAWGIISTLIAIILALFK